MTKPVEFLLNEAKIDRNMKHLTDRCEARIALRRFLSSLKASIFEDKVII